MNDTGRIGFIERRLYHFPGSVQQERTTSGRFVPAAHDLRFSPDSLLDPYKEQRTIEPGYRFLKDTQYSVPGVFLKKKSGIPAPAMVQGLCLFIYPTAGFGLRQALRHTGETGISRTEKQTPRPTFETDLFLFQRVKEHPAVVDGK